MSYFSAQLLSSDRLIAKQVEGDLVDFRGEMDCPFGSVVEGERYILNLDDGRLLHINIDRVTIENSAWMTAYFSVDDSD